MDANDPDISDVPAPCQEVHSYPTATSSPDSSSYFDTSSEMTSGDSKTSGTSWCNHPIYRRYWKHYHQMWAWFDHHNRFLRDYYTSHQQMVAAWYNQWTPWENVPAASYYGNLQDVEKRLRHMSTHSSNGVETWQRDTQTQNTPSSAGVPKGLSLDASKQERGNRKMKTSRKSRRRKDKKRRSRLANGHQRSDSDGVDRRVLINGADLTVADGNVAGDSTDDEDEQYEMEITEEMMHFFATSARHRQERDAARQEERESDDYVPLGEVTSTSRLKPTVLPPSERPGARRTAEMKFLYGKGAAMIHGMETAIQLTFDRNCDRDQPVLWPQLPIHIKFN